MHSFCFRVLKYSELLEAAVLEIVTLTISKAYARFKCEAHACYLRLLCTGWATSTVQCIVLDPKKAGAPVGG